MPITEVKVSQETFEEIANGLEAQGLKVNKESSVTLTKDISIKGPINYRQTAIRKDVLIEVVKVYKSKIDEREMEVSDSLHFINFLDDVYLYVLKGEKPDSKPKELSTKAEPKTKAGWN